MSQITLLDGSIGQELVHRHGKKPTPLWSSFVMLEDPSKVRALHEDYYAAGATVATANSYPVLPDRMAENGVPEQLEPLLKAAGSAARAATDANGQGRVIGALGRSGPPIAPISPTGLPMQRPAMARSSAHWSPMSTSFWRKP